MNKFKKVITGLVIAGGVSCLAGAAACSSNGPEFYTLTFSGSGLDYVMQGVLAEPDENNDSFRSGGTVKDGVEVRFTLSLGANTTGTPQITANGETLTPDADGVYSFIMKSDTKVEAAGLNSIYNLTLSRFEQVIQDGQTYDSEMWITYLDENGEEFSSDVLVDDVIRVEGGKPFKFKLNVSPYYVQKYTVSCDTEILEPDANGVYTVENLRADTTVAVSGLEMEESFLTGRENCGSGTADDPYLLSEPIDLFYLAYVVNSSFYDEYNSLYYKLAKDIDMKGERLLVIGDYSNAAAIFTGHFDGNGKKISNFRITDEVVNQSTYEEAILPYVGLFGYASANLDSGAAEIKNLTLENYRIDLHAGAAEQITLAGSIVGYGVGVEISNCRVDGEIIATGNDNQIMMLGGVAGRLQAGYYDDGTAVSTFDSFVRSTVSNARITGNGSPRSAGGIAGYLVSANVNAIAYVVNCASTADVSGAMHTGGIVGTLGMFSSVSNCYSTSGVNANNAISADLIDASYQCAYAGGIAGFAEENTAISGCYAANRYLNASGNSSYRKLTGDFYGYCDTAGSSATGSQRIVDVNNAKSVQGNPASVFTDTLGWNESEWTFADGALPQPVALPLAGTRTIRITVNDGTVDGPSSELHVAERTVLAATPMYSWYEAEGGSLLPEYLEGDGAERSWGYYFDKEMTVKVPHGFVPTGSITLYAGFADYSEVAGTYYFAPTTRGNGAYITFNADGTYLIRNGGMYADGIYTYDGEKIMVLDSELAMLTNYSDTSHADSTGGFSFTFEAGIDGGELTFNGRVNLVTVTVTGVDENGQQQTSTSYNNTELQFTAVKEYENFRYGSYHANDGLEYTFEKNGMGRFIEGNVSYPFVFLVRDTEITISPTNGGTMTGVVSDGEITSIDGVAVSRRDGFYGEWKKTANSLISFSFDGLGNVTCSDGKNPAATVEYGLVHDNDGVVSFNWNGEYKASFTDDGVLIINNESYFAADGFTGTWFLPNTDELINLTLDGVGTNGFGNAVISYTGAINVSVNAQYDVLRSGSRVLLRVFAGDEEYGELVYDSQDRTIAGNFRSMVNSGFYTNAEFSMYDAFRGTWVCNAEDIDTLTFNGRTALGTADVTLRTTGGRTRKGTYTLTGANSGTVTVTVNGTEKTYNLTLDEFAGKVVLTAAETEDIELAQRDEWYRAVLTDGSGKTYTFDGKGYVGGKVTVSGESVPLPYEITDGKVMLDGVELKASASGGFDWKEDIHLSFNTGFAGNWYVGGTLETLTVIEVDGDFNAKVTYSGGQGDVMFRYNPSTGALTLTEDENGVRVITTITLMGANELSIGRSGGSESTNINCLKAGGEDEWRGTFTAADGSSWTFDGLGRCAYGSGTATYTVGRETVSYKYKVDAQGIVNIRTDSGLLFVEAESGESGYVKDGKAYKTVTPDYLYGERVFIETDGVRVWYYFDGRSTLWLEVGNGYEAAYEYEIVSAYRLELTDKSTGKVYDTVMTANGIYYGLTLTEKA